MAPSDERAFFDFVQTTGQVFILGLCSESDSPVRHNSFGELVYPDITNWRPQGYLWNRDVSPAPTLPYLSRRSKFCLDLQSELVEFSPTPRDDDTMWPGRLYVDPTRLVHGQVVAKGAAFLEWHGALARWLRRAYRYDRSQLAYIGPGADNLVTKGWKLR
jgi:hypothetical protein